MLGLTVGCCFAAGKKLVDAVCYRPGKQLLIGGVLKPRRLFSVTDKTGLNQNAEHPEQKNGGLSSLTRAIISAICWRPQA